MTENSGIQSGTDQELIAAYRRSEKSRAVARRSITLLVLGVIAINVCVLWTTVQAARDRLPEYTAALGVEMMNLSPKFLEDVRGMVNRLYPQYVTAFQNMFERDLPKMKESAFAEIGKLESHAQQWWPEIENGVTGIVLATEKTAQEELERFITAGEAKGLSEAYGEALQKQYDLILTAALKQHIKSCEEIGGNLEKLVAAEPTVKQPVDLREALGMFFELVGTELQQRY